MPTTAAFVTLHNQRGRKLKALRWVTTTLRAGSSVIGKKGAGNDYLVQLMRLWDTVNARYETDLSPETRALCEAYAGGVNHYAALHPRETVPGLGRVTGKHIVAGFVHKMPLMVGVDRVLKELFEKPAKTAARPLDSMLRTAFRDGAFSRLKTGIGSNSLAVSPRRSAGGETMLAVNSHQPWEGPVTWYEVQVRSDEGWNMTGGLFPFLFTGISVWKEVGYSAIIFLAALAGVNPELYESAVIDGASRLQQTRYITLPSISQTILIVFVLSFTGVLNLFEPIYVTRNDMVISTAEVIDTYTYDLGIVQARYPLATAVGLFKSSISLVFVLLVNFISRRWTEEKQAIL